MNSQDKMNFVLNEVDIEGIRHEEFQGSDYLVAPVTAMKAMDLDGGYVPRQHIVNSAPAWNGTPVTLYHPVTSEGERVSANSPDVAEKTWLGYFFNTEVVKDGERLDGEVWIKTEDVSGEPKEVVDRLENGEGLAVSTSYFGDKLGSGEYDGEFRENAVGNLKPDHLAILPEGDGRCSVDDGCMVGSPATNAPEIATYPDEDSMENEHDPEEFGNEARKGVIAGLTDYFGGNINMTNREDMIEVLVNQHGFKKESLDGMGDNCIERTFTAFDNEDDIEPEVEEEEPLDEEPTETDVSEDEVEEQPQTIEMTPEEFDKRVKKTAEEILAANQEAEKKAELIETIVSNDDSLETDDLQATPVSVLESMASDVEETEPVTNFAAQRGAAANSEDGSDFPALSVNETRDE